MPTAREMPHIRKIIAEVAAYNTHTFDHATGYCCYCGQAEACVQNQLIHCFGDGHQKIVPISHLRRPPVDEITSADTIWKNPA